MKVKNYYLLLAFFILILAAVGCDTSNRPATGLEDEIYVVADSAEYVQLSNALDSTFEKVIYTPQPENLFTLKRISVNQINNYNDRKNIIIAAPLNSSSHTSQYIRAVVDSAAIKKLLADSSFVIKKYNAKK